MRKQDYLPALIKSMDANEKRHFKLLSDHEQGDKNYVRLFDALDGKEKYNAVELRKTLGISAGDLSSLKHYLTQVLLKSLRYYKESTYINAELANSVIEAYILRARGLGDFAVDILDKAIVRAREEEASLELPRLLFTQHWMLNHATRYDELPALQSDFFSAQQISTEFMQLNGLNSLMTAFEQSRKPPEEFPLNDHIFFQTKPEDLLSHRARMLWYSIMNRYHLVITKDREAMINLARGEVAFFESSPSAREVWPHDFLISTIRLMTTEYQHQNYQEAWDACEKLTQLLTKKYTKVNQGYINDMILFARIVRGALHFVFERYEEAAKASRALYEEKDKMIPYVQHNMIYEYAKALMLLRRSGEASDRIDELLQYDPDMRLDLQPNIRVMMILVQLDLGNYQIVPYLVKSARQWMKRRKISNADVELFLSYVYSIASATMSKRKQAWAKLQAAVNSDELPILTKELHLKNWYAEVPQK